MEFNANVKRFNSEPSNANFLHFCTGFKFRSELDKCPTFSFESAHKSISVEWKTFNHRDIFHISLLRRIKIFTQNKPFCFSIEIVWTAFSHGNNFYISYWFYGKHLAMERSFSARMDAIFPNSAQLPITIFSTMMSMI